MKLLVYAFAAVGFALWVFTPRRKVKRKPGPWIQPSQQPISLQRVGKPL